MQSTSRRRRIAALAVGMISAVPVLVAIPGAPAQTVGQISTGENYRQGNEILASRGRDVPGLAVNPTDPNHVVSVDVDFLHGECSWKTSFDGGITWPFAGDFDVQPSVPGGSPDVNAFPDPPCYQNFDSGGYAHGNANVVFGSGNNVYTAFSVHRGPYQRPESGLVFGRGDDSVVVRSTDGGRTFLPGVPAITGDTNSQPFFIRPQVVTDPGKGTGGQDRVYVAAWACRVINSGCSGGNDLRQMWVSRSDDSGQTWSERKRASDPVGPCAAPACTNDGSQVNEPSHPVLDPRDGTIYLAYRRRDNLNSTQTFPIRSEVEVAKSTDLGETWTRSTVATVAIITPPTGNPNPQLAHPRAAINPVNGHVYVVWQDARLVQTPTADQDIFFSRTTDAGASWSAPKRINDDPSGAAGNFASQRVPRVEVAPDGRIDVAWLDRRHDPIAVSGSRGLSDVYYSHSLDGGLTFSANRRVSDRHFNLDVGLTGVGGYTWYGPVLRPLGNDTVLFAWTDSREGNFNNGTQDVYLARMNVRNGTTSVKRMAEVAPPSMSVAMGRLAYPGGLEGRGGTTVPVSRPVVVNENDPASALVAAPLARTFFAPLLASPAARLTHSQRAEVARMEPVGAFVIGDESTLGTGVVSALTEAGTPADQVVRLAGSSPADTARQVALAMDPRTPAQKTANAAAFPLAVVVNPTSKEAWAATGLAASMRVPILFADENSIPVATGQALSALAVTSTLVIGNSGVLSDAVLSGLPGSRRIGGADARAVSQQVAVEASSRGLPVNIGYVADPEQPIDVALAAATSARNGGLLILSPGADPVLAEDLLTAPNLRGTLDRLVVVKSNAGAGAGYRLVASDGGVFAFGRAGFFGSAGAMRLNRPMVAIANTPSNAGYWTAASDGGVFAFGDARFLGSTGNLRLARPVVGMAATPSGNGYWLVASDGGVFAFGDARFLGSTGAIRINQPIVSLVPTPTGSGYWLIAADGGVFAYGDARFFGSTGSMVLNRPVVGGAASASGAGYHLVAADGGVFAFGDAVFRGSTGNMRLNQPIVDMEATSTGGGYLMAATDGGVFAFGDAVFAGSVGDMRLNQPVVAMTNSLHR